jgi:hypothetical protein
VVLTIDDECFTFASSMQINEENHVDLSVKLVDLITLQLSCLYLE